ncbi:MAG: GGDEF domain-containing protein [Anaerosomatales bacterium]|nr:GGDEF domain-containing protein [Anaerosomatales bacterium]MDT8434006.1 GGDEF domain-containing protein [Anaerosomatales bacterium]
MPETERRPTSLHLAALVLVGITGVFATVLILMTGELLTLWPLYVVPIVIAALAYHVAGAILVSAISVALVAFTLYGTGLDPAALPELAIGMAAFTISAIVIGLQAQRSTRHGYLLEETSILDPLTGVYKRAHFERRLAEEIRRSERYGLRCSVVLVQVDCFDAFKELFGHYKAEMLLEHLGDVIRVSIRDHDIVGRYGPISFGILLPFAGPEGASSVADRLRAIVDETEFEGDVLEPVTRCVIRSGQATYPDDACERKGLLDIAEQRLEGGAS